MTEVQPFIQRGRIALRDGDSFKGLQEALADPYLPDVARTEMIPFPAVPAPVELTAEVKAALNDLPEVFGRVNPEVRRTLNDAEKHDVFVEREAISTLLKVLALRDEALKTIIRHHMDVDAEERGVAVPKAVVDPETGEVIVEATERTADGHYILCAKGAPERTPIPGTNKDWSREYRNGSIGINTDVLERLVEEGEIDRETYLAMTREVRVFDEDKARASATGKPALQDQILFAIRKMTVRGKPTVSLFTRASRKG